MLLSKKPVFRGSPTPSFRVGNPKETPTLSSVFSRKNQVVDKLLRKSSFDLQGLLACARGELFGPGNPQLPLPPMLMFDRITSITADGGEAGKGEVVAEFDIHPDLWFFKCHFEGDPVMPGCLRLDALWQM